MEKISEARSSSVTYLKSRGQCLRNELCIPLTEVRSSPAKTARTQASKDAKDSPNYAVLSEPCFQRVCLDLLSSL